VYKHVIWIWMENHPFSSIVGSSSAPYINRLAGACGLATNYQAITHPSLPNYIAATSGGTQGITTDCSPDSCTTAAPSIFTQVQGAGKAWRAYSESMPSPCALSNDGSYLVRHNPAAYYSGIRGVCGSWNVPMGSPSGGALLTALQANRLPAFTFLTPNACSDMHDCSISSGDQWLQGWLPRILSSKTYRLGGTAVFITWDEGSGDDNRVPTIVVSPSTPRGTRSAASFTHYSLLKTAEQLLGLKTFLGEAGAATTNSMRRAFHL
jgi:phospholipase C